MSTPFPQPALSHSNLPADEPHHILLASHPRMQRRPCDSPPLTHSYPPHSAAVGSAPRYAEEDGSGVLEMPTLVGDDDDDTENSTFVVPGVLVDEDASLASSTASTARARVVPHLTRVLPGKRLFIGAQRSITQTLCEELEIDAFLCCAAELEDSLPPCVHPSDIETRRVTHLHLRLEDDNRTQLLRYVDTALDFIDSNIAARRGVVVYCQQGQSRSVSVVLAFLMRELGVTSDEALVRLRQVYRSAEPNLSFLMQLKGYQHSPTTRGVGN